MDDDIEIIRRAVELAAGFRVRPGINSGKDVEWVDTPTTAGFHKLADLEQEAKDALAAQLVRQVDALKWDTIIWRNGTGIYDRLLKAQTHIEGPDRTMNTLRAIVESKVLE